jgi:hypothetical protein
MDRKLPTSLPLLVGASRSIALIDQLKKEERADSLRDLCKSVHNHENGGQEQRATINLDASIRQEDH